MKARLTKPFCFCLWCYVQPVFHRSSKCCIISRNSDHILEVHFLLSGSSCIAVAEAVQSDMGEKHCLHLFKISSALCGSWATGRNPEKLGCTCSIVAGSCDFERAHSSSLAGCLCCVTCTKHVKL